MTQWKLRENASDDVLSLLVYAVLTVLGMRLFLQVFGTNRQISFGVWHIAHMLWGGLFLLISLLILVIFENKKSRSWAMVLGGVGWGLFIDEVGKFLTKDNDYWFQPAIIFIYVSFIVIFMLYRWLENKQQKLRKFEPSQWELIIAKISKSTYNRIFRKKLVTLGMAAYSIFYAVDKIIDTIRIIFNQNRLFLIESFNKHYEISSKADINMISMKIGSEVIVAVMFLVGVVLIVNRRKNLGLKFYKNGLLVSILLTSVFRFYFEQFSAVFWLILDMLVYSWIVYYYKEKQPV